MKITKCKKGSGSTCPFKLLLSIGLIFGVIAIIFYGTTGNFLKGMSFTKVEPKMTDSALNHDLESLAKIDSESHSIGDSSPVTQAESKETIDTIIGHPEVYFAYREQLPGQTTMYNGQTPGTNNIVLVWNLTNRGDAGARFNNIVVNTGDPSFENCSVGMGSDYDMCEVRDYPVAKGGTLYKYEQQSNGSYKKVFLANDSNNDGVYQVVDPMLTQVDPDDNGYFFIEKNVEADIGYWEADYVSGSAFILREETVYVDENCGAVTDDRYFHTDQTTVTPRSIRFR